MKIIGLTRIRNESLIISDTLDHLSEFCDDIYVYDDASTDNTVEICKTKEKVRKVLENKTWSTEDRPMAETHDRKKLLEYARQNANKDDWFVYIDADERIEFDWELLKKANFNAVKMRLFDFYITKEDVDKNYKDRKWLGPEYREIIIAFKNSNELNYSRPVQREVTLPKKSKAFKSGYVKHYGKAISVEEWESTCDYYGKYFKEYSKKWLKRKGKAIHAVSDYGRELIQWHEKEEYGSLLGGKTIKKIQIIGLQRSATNYVEQLIRLNYKVEVFPNSKNEIYTDIVWKHSLPFPDVIGKLNKSEILTIVIQKELSKWLISISNDKQDIDTKYPVDYPNRLTDLYKKFYRHWEEAKIKNKETIDYKNLLLSFRDRLLKLEKKYKLERKNQELIDIKQVPCSALFTKERRDYYIT